MATKFRYSGPTLQLGHFGSVSDGQFIFVTDDELPGVINDARFTQVDSTSSDQRQVEIAFDEIGVFGPGTNKQSIRMPCSLYLTSIRAYVDYPQASAVVLDVNKDGTSILSTKVTVDASETTNETSA